MTKKHSRPTNFSQTDCNSRRSGEMPLELRLLLEMRAFLGQDLGGALRGEAQIDEGRLDIGDLAAIGDLAVAARSS